nr:ulp1 protease family, C-terminal catalytic domain-containing protein [Tanacetum cinerariifolium]
MLKCNQQVALWECGYYVMKFVFEILYIKQKTFSDQVFCHRKSKTTHRLEFPDVGKLKIHPSATERLHRTQK